LKKLALIIAFGFFSLYTGAQTDKPVINFEINPKQPVKGDSVHFSIHTLFFHDNGQIADRIERDGDTFTVRICTKLSPLMATRFYNYAYKTESLDTSIYKLKVTIYETDDSDSCEKYLLNSKDTIFRVLNANQNGVRMANLWVQEVQVYPNPAGNIQTIAFALQKKNNISITLYDITGRTIKTIANKEFSSGQHQIEINTSEISPGMYFYKIVSGREQSFVKTLIERK
jgi:hypothetical protein